MEAQKHTRRTFLRMSAFTAAGVALAACSQPAATAVPAEPTAAPAESTAAPEATATTAEEAAPTETTEEAAPAEAPSKYSESPMLAAMVAEGTLPPVEDRLPEEPLVVTPLESVGTFGGTMRVGTQNTGYYDGDCGLLGTRQELLRITPNIQSAVPNILKDWSVSDDFTVVDCYMRKGMKWSDGQPLTSDDFLFMYEDWMLNTDLTPVVASYFQPGGEVMKLDVIDEYHFRLTFAISHPSFVLVNMAHRYGWWDYCFAPRHYLEQFHIKYNADANALAQEAGYDFWYQYYANRANPNQNMDVPVTRGYIVVKDTPQQVFLQRNPYLFMVDTEGNQLPYIDEILLDRVADKSLLDPKIVGGQYDFAGFETNIQNYTTYQEAAEQGGYHLVLWRSGKGSDVVYNVNMNWPEQQIRDVFSDVRYRRALSLAINREEINQIIYYGNGTPRQMTVIPDSRHFKPEYETAWADYDVDQANALLDEMGLEWDADHKLRLWPDGTPMIVSFDIYESETPKGPITQLVKEYWMAIGVQIEYKSVTRTLLTQKIQGNQEPMSLWHGDETTDTLFLRRPKYFTPEFGDESCWAENWGLWYNTHGEQGEEPPDEIKELYDLMDEYNRTDSDEPAAKVLASNAENIWTMGTVGNAPQVLIVNDKLKNVTDAGYWTWDCLWTYPNRPEQWYFES